MYIIPTVILYLCFSAGCAAEEGPDNRSHKERRHDDLPTGSSEGDDSQKGAEPKVQVRPSEGRDAARSQTRLCVCVCVV